MNAFRIGDVCVIVSSQFHPEVIGEECVIAGPLCMHQSVNRLAEQYPVSLKNERWYALPSELRLKRPPSEYDCNQAGDWTLCPWAPNRHPAKAREVDRA